MKLDWDLSGLTEFAKNLKDGWYLETALMTATQTVARVLHQNILNLTPVKTGNLRKMWSAGDNLMFTVDNVDDGYEVTFINTAKNPEGYMYGTDVNDGHPSENGGWIMGRFFVEKAITQVEESNTLERVIYHELQKWWEGV